jgi:hypothetical protein
MQQKSKHLIIKILVFGILILFYCSADVKAETEITLSKGQTVYVPIYSHIYSGNNEIPFFLTATLSIRNTDPKQSITILAADYYDSNGKLLKKYIPKPVQLGPITSTHFIIQESDKAGGAGANFIVQWKSENPANIPIIESIMIGTKSSQGVSFTSRGQAIRDGIE